MPKGYKPPAAGKGRKAGTPNKVTTALKEAILAAANAVGEDGNGRDGLLGYCKRLALKDPKSFSTLLGKVLPTQINADINFLDRLSHEDRVALEAALIGLAGGQSDADEGASQTQH